MDGWIGIPMTAAVGWIGYALGRANLPSERELQEIRAIAGSCRQCNSVDTEYLDFIDWPGSLRSRTLVRGRTGFCGSCRHEWPIESGLRNAA